MSTSADITHPTDRHGDHGIERATHPVGDFVRKYIWQIAIVVMAIGLPLTRTCLTYVPEPPPRLNQLSGFAMTDQAGEPFSLADLEGKVWVASFVFTTCPTTCPKVTSSMAALQKRLLEADVPVHLVTFSVDPEYDTPERLKAYADKYGADLSTWHFLRTETAAEMSDVVVGGFRTAMGPKKETQAGMFDIAHTTKLALVDGDGWVRGYYSSDDLGIDEVFHRAQHVLKQQREEADE